MGFVRIEINDQRKLSLPPKPCKLTTAGLTQKAEMMIFCDNCISQRDGLHAVPLPRIDNLIGQGLDLAIQAERETAMSISHLPDHYIFCDNLMFQGSCRE